MEKQKADAIIEQYLKPLYGFAVNRTGSTEKAEELAASIVLEVYSALLTKDDILDVNAYIFKIAHNVWVRFHKDRFAEKNNLSVDDIQLGADFSLEEDIIKSAEYRLLRREIAYLSQQRRSIVMAYYYNGRKISEIASDMNMSEGTVKWHLFECKKEIKKGMERIRSIGNLGMNPIKFKDMGHNGIPGGKGDTADFLSKSLTQNAAYACYFEAHTINEIADELGVSPIFIADEVKELAEYGFLDLLPGGKYRTNMIITGHPESLKNQGDDICEQYAGVLVDKYFGKLLDIQRDAEALPIYYTDHDYNFLLWSLIMYSAQKLYYHELEVVKHREVTVMRPDGGSYIAYAHLDIPEYQALQIQKDWSVFCGYMKRGSGNIRGLKLTVYWSGEPLEWRANTTEDYKLMYHFINGSLPKDDRNMDSYESLTEKGYLIKNGSNYRANIVYIPDHKTQAALDRILPKAGSDIFEIAKALDEQIYKKRIIGQPRHMHKAIRLGCQNTISCMHVYAMKHMLDRGMLKLPTDEQRKQICNMLFHQV